MTEVPPVTNPRRSLMILILKVKKENEIVRKLSYFPNIIKSHNHVLMCTYIKYEFIDLNDKELTTPRTSLR